MMGVDPERAARLDLAPSPWDVETQRIDAPTETNGGGNPPPLTAPASRSVGNRWHAYTDGSVAPNPGAGGWGVIIIAPDGTRQELSGSEPKTTNNRMELAAILAAVRGVPEGASIAVTSDSEYAVRVSSGRYKAKKNRDLVQAVRRAAENRRVKYQWIRGHAGHALNEAADRLAGQARLGQRVRRPAR